MSEKKKKQDAAGKKQGPVSNKWIMQYQVSALTCVLKDTDSSII